MTLWKGWTRTVSLGLNFLERYAITAILQHSIGGQGMLYNYSDCVKISEQFNKKCLRLTVPCLGLLKNRCTMHSCHNKYLHCFHCRGTAHNYQDHVKSFLILPRPRLGMPFQANHSTHICLRFGIGDPEKGSCYF